jgi:serine/threonine-protein kinase
MPRNWPRVEGLYHAAMERPVAEREAFLDEACGGDEELRREVQSLLAVERDAERLMEEPAASAATQKLAVVRGTRLGPYEVMDLVGAGGMGEVYRARDTRLGRDVAIKVLPEHVAHDAGALARFGREARAAAALSHPHIAALFDIGATDGTHYLVMELLEGETLAARLRRGGLPEKDALRIGAEIAEGLGAAHAHGIVHRDVKPANVMLTRSGVKLLDFGLARLQRRPDASGETASMTGLGGDVLAGTLPYMAPEQLEGREADARTDIWALGCVLFEMLAGRRAFEGNSQAGLIAAIEKDDVPSVARRRPAASPALDRLVGQCLKKDPADRWQSSQDLALRLREIADSGSEAPASGRRVKSWRLVLPALGAAAALLAAGALAGRMWLRPAAEPGGPVVRSFIDLPFGTQIPSTPHGAFTHPGHTEIALSPDGTLLAWSGSPDGTAGKAALYLRAMATGEARRLPGTEGARQPLFSPDGRWIAFIAEGKLRKVPVDGGLSVDVATGGGGAFLGDIAMGAFWGENDRVLLGSWARGIREVPAGSGPGRDLTRVDLDLETGDYLPWALPGGRSLLVTTHPHYWGVRARVEAVSLVDGARKALAEDCADGRYLPTGHLVCVRQGALMAAPFDVGRLELKGPLVPVVPGVQQALNVSNLVENSGAGQFTVSRSGVLVYASGGIFEEPRGDLVLVDESGRMEPLPGFDRPLCSVQFQFSPDGRRLAFVERAQSGLLWLYDLERRTYRALSHDGMAGTHCWSPDGTHLVVSWSKSGPFKLWQVPVDGGGEWERLTRGGREEWVQSWSPDGSVLAFMRAADILLYRFADRQVVPFLATPANEMTAEFSPDGRWMAYVSDEDGRLDVHVTSYPDRRQTLVVSAEGGEVPVWSRDGRRLYYSSDDQASLMRVDVRPGACLTLDPPSVLFQVKPNIFFGNRAMVLHPDGRRFLFLRLAAPKPPTPITRLNVVHNWFTELERLCPTRR